MTRIPEKLAHWYFINYIRPLAQDWLYAELAKVEMKKNEATKRYVGDRN